VTKRAVFIVNPAARSARRFERLPEALAAMAGWEASIAPTEAATHATELAREAAARGIEMVVACGGDGTVNEVANGLAGSETALGVVRGGTANVWAKEIRMPKRVDRAVAALASGETRTVDLGRAGERYFLCVAGAGFDAAIVREVHAGVKSRFGAMAYVLHALRRAFSQRAVEAEMRANGDALSGQLYWLVLGNTRSYAGVLNITDRALVDDGVIDLCLLRCGGPHRLLWLALMVVLHRHHERAHVVSRPVGAFEIATPGLPVQVDGEYLGETPMRFEVAPGALRVIVPRGYKGALFSIR
jgi:YegS/Rv2252/BmrU family lipid kinase